MDLECLQMVLNDFTVKQLSIISWLDSNLDKNMEDRNVNILNLLRKYCNEELDEWTTLKIEHALMAIGELKLLNRNEEKELAEELHNYLTTNKCSNNIIEPYVNKCCSNKLKMSLGKIITIFGINKSCTATTMCGLCEICKRKYFHNYFIDGKEKFVTCESIDHGQLIYMGGIYGYEKPFLKWLSNSILYLYSGFQNFCKCFNETKRWTCNSSHQNEENLSPTCLQDFWFLYNFITISFFYTNRTILKIPFTW